MKKDNSELIEQFVGYFLKEIDEIKSLRNNIAKKILYISIIDTIARTRFPKSCNRERIVSFMEQFSGWSDKSRVSLPQLLLNLDFVLVEEEKEKSKLYQYVQEQIALWKEGNIYRPDVDPEFEDLVKIASIDERNAVRYARYDELFFTYRHKMIHEFREPGYGMELSNDESTPYYHSYQDKPWQLVFPVGIFQKVCEGCLANLKKFLLERNTNPYESYEFGDMWIEKDKLSIKNSYLINDPYELNLNFYTRFDESYLYNKALTLISVTDNMDEFFKISEIEEEEKSDRKKYKESLNAEVYFSEIHQIESLFAYLLAPFQRWPHWIYLTTYQTKEIKKAIGYYLNNNVTLFTSGVLNNLKDFLQVVIYSKFKSSDEEKANQWDKNLDNIDWFLKRIGERYLDAKEFNAYKHGLRVLTGEAGLFVGLDSEPGKMSCVDKSENSLSYLELKDEGKNRLRVFQTTKLFNPVESLNNLFVMQLLLKNIKNTRLARIKQEQKAKLYTFFELDHEKFLGISKRTRFSFSA